ncbi:MAG: two-component system, cell cycle sensor histidine kinase and response regulator CckA [Gemmatimonadaceae bacterium]|nr:two-component system, cell cycle sensor histidine kinase and response regulator CckA [Gemmatimonadaceae bacterium]
MIHSYDTFLVVLSVVVAMLASFAALDLAGRVRSESGVTRLGWLAGGGTVMGLGIWSMHFVGMLAFHLSVPIEYDVPLMLLSMLVAVAASLLALVVVNRPLVGMGSFVPAGILMGAAIAGMHYIGMASMRVEASRGYSASIVAMSVLIAILASLVALWLAFRFRSDTTTTGRLLKVVSAIVMGVAISGMHYTAMAAAHFDRGTATGHSSHDIVASGQLAGVIAASAILIILLALIGAVIDRSMQERAAFTKRLGEQTDLLTKSEQQYRLLFDHNPNAMWVYDDSTHFFLAVNEAAIQRYGYSRDEFLSLTRGDIRVQADARPPKRVAISAEATARDQTWNGRHRKKDGSIIDVSVTSHLIMFDGRAAQLALALDVTDARRTEEDLRQSEQRTRLILDNALDAVITMRASGVISDWNAQAEKMFGIARAEALGKQMSSTIIPHRYRERHDAGLRKFLSTGEGPVLNKRIEITALHNDGHEFPVELSISPAKVGDRWTFSAFIRDLTEQKKAQEAVQLAEVALQASERRLIQILETVPLGIFVANEVGQIVFANAGAQKIVGKGIVPTANVGELAEVYQAYLAGTDQLYPVARMPLVRALTGEAATVDDMEIHQGRQVISLIVKGAPILDHEGKIVAAVVAFIDTTERRLLEAQVGQTSKMQAVGQLAGGVAHDFNNLLTVIMSYGAMLVERLEPGEDREDVQEITAAADRAAGLTRQLLAFSRQQVMQPRVMDLNDVVGGLEKMLRRLIGEDIELQITLDPSIEAINADPGQLEQVLMNLVVNARDAMPGGGRLTIGTSNSQLSAESSMGTLQAPDGDYVMLAVSDSGCGMTRAVQQRIFDPFFTTKELSRGTGLGLATVYGIVKQSGGEIYVYSELGRGTTFKIYFPRFTLDPAERPEDAHSTELRPGSESILLVEDDANLRALVARVLKDRGYTVHVAASGIEALVIASDPHTLLDAVITDVVMPGMNGREVVEKLRESRPTIGSLLMSGYTDDEVLRRGVLQGETAFLQKPFTPDQLARKIRAVLDRATVDISV